jgi:hypothetical protein
MQATRKEYLSSSVVSSIDVSSGEIDCTKPERPVRIYSYWGSPLDNVGEDGDFVLEEISGSLIGPKENGKWPEDFVRIEGPVVGKRGCFPRWRSAERRKSTRKGLVIKSLKMIVWFLLTGGRVRTYGA